MIEPQRRITKAYFEIAIKQYEPMAQRMASVVGLSYSQRDECMSQARTELLKCMICYQNVGSFITFFHHRLLGAFRHMRDVEKRAKRIQTSSMEGISDPLAREYDIDTSMMVEECLGCLTSEQRYVIVELFFNHRTMRQISSDRGIALSTLCRVKNKAIDRMRNKCEA